MLVKAGKFWVGVLRLSTVATPLSNRLVEEDPGAPEGAPEVNTGSEAKAEVSASTAAAVCVSTVFLKVSAAIAVEIAALEVDPVAAVGILLIRYLVTTVGGVPAIISKPVISMRSNIS